MLTPAYTAGLFDGEGTASLIFVRRGAWKSDPTKSVYGFKLSASIANTHGGILEILKSQYGGNISRGSRETGEHRKAVWQWRISSAPHQVVFLSAIQPFCIIKSGQVRLALSYLTTAVEPGHRLTQESWDKRIGIFREMRALNQRGAAKDPKNPIPNSVPTGLKPRQFYSDADLTAMMSAARTAKRK